MEKIQLTELEEKFCLVYVSGPSPYNGNATKCYDLVFNKVTGVLKRVDDDDDLMQGERDVEIALKARELMRRDEIRDRIDQLQSETLVNATTLRPRLTETLLKIADECSTAQYKDKFGTVLSPAALRSVAVNAISKLTDMYGIKEDIAHKVMLEGADGDGITFNIITPTPNKEAENVYSDVID